MSDIAKLLESARVPVSRGAGGETVVTVPSEKRGTVTVAITEGEATVRLRAFLMRSPDRARVDVYGRLLWKNLHTRWWRFALDPVGDVFIVADVGREGDLAGMLDGLLGELARLVDEVYEGLVRTGFDLPEGVRLGPPPE